MTTEWKGRKPEAGSRKPELESRKSKSNGRKWQKELEIAGKWEAKIIFILQF